MNIVITGASGFVGSNLVQFLKKSKNHFLTGLDRNEQKPHHYDKFIPWSQIDTFDWSKVDIIIHLAGKAHDTNNVSEPQIYFDINLGLTKKIADIFFSQPVKKLIFFSSVKAVADTIGETVLTEDSQCDPKTPYGLSKLAAEQYILSKSQTGNKQVFILRPCMIHGPGNKGNLNLLYSLVKKGVPWPLGAFENKRSFVAIQNLQFVINQLIEKHIETGVYQVADDEPLSTNTLIRLIAHSLNKKPHIWKLPESFVNLFAKTGNLLRLPLNSERLKKLTESYIVSNQKLKNALDIKRLPLTSEEGMQSTFSSFSQNSHEMSSNISGFKNNPGK